MAMLALRPNPASASALATELYTVNQKPIFSDYFGKFVMNMFTNYLVNAIFGSGKNRVGQISCYSN